MPTRLSSNEHNSIAAAMHIVALSAIARAFSAIIPTGTLSEILADDLLRSMLDQTVKSIVEIADLIEKELNQPVPVASHRESSGNG